MPKAFPKRWFASGILLVYLLQTLPAVAIEAPPTVASVTVVGSQVPVNLTTQAGRPFNAGFVAHDVHELWATGRFDDIRVEAVQVNSRINLRFLVKESSKRSLREIRIEPNSFGLHPKVLDGAPVNALRAHEIALEARKQLNEEGYVNARVEENIVPVSRHAADLHLTVHAGKPVDVNGVEFLGSPALEIRELRGALRSLRIRRVLPGIPGLWKGWRMLPAYSPEAVESDLNHLRSLYISRGYYDAVVRLDEAAIEGRAARIRIDIQSGQHYRTSDLTVNGGAQQPARHVRPENLCPCLLAARRDAENKGVLDFSALLTVRRLNPGTATLTADIEQGLPYRVGRIEFQGNHHYTDSAVRRSFQLDEGQPLDRQRLRNSLSRLNQSMQFEPVDEHSVTIRENEGTGTADVLVQLTEHKSRAWSISGPVGPASVAGPLQGSLSSRLPPWGKGLLELSTYSASISLIAFAHPLIPLLATSTKRFLPVLSLQRPFTPGEGWLSGFMIAPQLGWQLPALNYGIVQLQHRLRPPAVEPELPVAVTLPRGTSALICEQPRPRLAAWRSIAVIAVRFLSVISSL
jgi:outer membrane protein assembly factor BamA